MKVMQLGPPRLIETRGIAGLYSVPLSAEPDDEWKERFFNATPQFYARISTTMVDFPDDQTLQFKSTKEDLQDWIDYLPRWVEQANS
jgi:hypothetical protein